MYIFPEFVGHTLENVSMMDSNRTNTVVDPPPVQAADSNVSYEDLMARVRHLVLTNRRRVCIYASPFPPSPGGRQQH